MLIKIADKKRPARLAGGVGMGGWRHQVVAAPPVPRPLVAAPQEQPRPPPLESRRLLVSGGCSPKGCESRRNSPALHHKDLSPCTFAASAAAVATTSSFTSGGRRAPRSRSGRATTRAAFATADIRRALARLAEADQQPPLPVMRHFELGQAHLAMEKAFRPCHPAAAAAANAAARRQSSFSSRGAKDDEQNHAAQVVVWSGAKAKAKSSSGEPKEISSSSSRATVISVAPRSERHHSNLGERNPEHLRATDTGGCGLGEEERRTRTKDTEKRVGENIQIESYGCGTRSQVAQEPRASAYANSCEHGEKKQQVCVLKETRCNKSKQENEQIKPSFHRQEKSMSTQIASLSLSSSSSFVPGGDQLASNHNTQPREFHHLSHEQAQVSAHPIGLGCFGGAKTTGGGGQTMEPVPGASDNSVVMTSSGALSPDDDLEHESFVPRSNGAETRPHQLRHSVAGGLAGDSSQLSLNGGGGSTGKSFLGKLVGKKASRFRELVLQNLGKADRTQDELFDVYEVNFYKQQHQVARLTKEFKLYSTALKSYHEASKSLNKCIQQATTDYQSARHDLVCENLTHLEQLNEDLMEKLQEQVMRSVGEYLSKFEETKEKISKRHRKLIDYDSSRRLYELMLASVTKKRSRQQQEMSLDSLSSSQQQQHQHQQHPQNYQSILRGLKFLSQQQQQQQQQQPQQLQESIASQLVDEARLLKLREQFNYCKLMYENINSELHEELPIVHEKKMKSLLQALQNYYAIKSHYHSNAGKLLSVVSEVIDECPQSINAVLGINRKETKRQSGSSSTNYDDDDDDSNDDHEYGQGEGESGADLDKARSQQHIITGGGGSSGVGSSRGDSVVDSASSPSSSSSPDCAEAAATDRMSPSGKAHGPADLSCGEQQYAPECSQSVGERVAGDGSADGAEPSNEEAAIAGDVNDKSSEQQEATIDEALKGIAEPEASETKSQAVDIDKEQPSGGAKEELEDEVEIKILNTTKPSSAKCEEPQGDELDDSAVVQGVEEKPFLYKVKTNYKYLAEDVDELCFEADEIIQVIEFDENHEPEDGWLLGIREVNNQRGLFPANFTQPI